MKKFFKRFTWRRLGFALKSAWRFVSPFADKAIAMAKPMLIAAYDREVDRQQGILVDILITRGPAMASKHYDKMQQRLCDLVDSVTVVPQGLRDKACGIIEDEGNKFQRQFIATITNQGVTGLNKLIDATQARIRERIETL